jgi:hypothetical protein
MLALTTFQKRGGTWATTQCGRRSRRRLPGPRGLYFFERSRPRGWGLTATAAVPRWGVIVTSPGGPTPPCLGLLRQSHSAHEVVRPELERIFAAPFTFAACAYYLVKMAS